MAGMTKGKVAPFGARVHKHETPPAAHGGEALRVLWNDPEHRERMCAAARVRCEAEGPERPLKRGYQAMRADPEKVRGLRRAQAAAWGHRSLVDLQEAELAHMEAEFQKGVSMLTMAMTTGVGSGTIRTYLKKQLPPAEYREAILLGEFLRKRLCQIPVATVTKLRRPGEIGVEGISGPGSAANRGRSALRGRG